MKQQFETKLDNLIAAQEARTFLGRLKLFSVLKRARTILKHDDYIALENKVMEAIKASAADEADELIKIHKRDKIFKLDEDAKGELLKVDPLDMSQSMGWTALEIAHKETVDAAVKALEKTRDKGTDEAILAAFKVYEETRETARKAFVEAEGIAWNSDLGAAVSEALKATEKAFDKAANAITKAGYEASEKADHEADAAEKALNKATLAMYAAHKALDKAIEPARKAYEEAEEAAFKAFKAKAKTLGVDLSKREVEGLWIMAAKVKFEQTRREKRRSIITRLWEKIATRKHVRKTSSTPHEPH